MISAAAAWCASVHWLAADTPEAWLLSAYRLHVLQQCICTRQEKQFSANCTTYCKCALQYAKQSSS
jgi:hypothetical protein